MLVNLTAQMKMLLVLIVPAFFSIKCWPYMWPILSKFSVKGVMAGNFVKYGVVHTCSSFNVPYIWVYFIPRMNVLVGGGGVVMTPCPLETFNRSCENSSHCKCKV